MTRPDLKLLHGDCLDALSTLESESVQTCVTSPPYWGLRDYGAEGQLGLEPTPELYVARLVRIFREVRRVLKKDGTLWLNLGDSYAGSWGAQGKQGKGEMSGRSIIEARQVAAATKKSSMTGAIPAGSGLKPKDLVGIPWMVAFALRADGWYLRSDIIWAKPNPMPESVRDRPTKSHEYLFLLAKSESYFYDAEAIKEQMKAASVTRQLRGWDGERRRGLPDGRKAHAFSHYGKKSEGTRNKRSVWTVTTSPYKGAHFATYPPKLIRPCILAGSGIGDAVLDPFNGAGTTGLVALQLRRRYIGIDINPDYLALTRERLADVQMEMFA